MHRGQLNHHGQAEFINALALGKALLMHRSELTRILVITDDISAGRVKIARLRVLWYPAVAQPVFAHGVDLTLLAATAVGVFRKVVLLGPHVHPLRNIDELGCARTPALGFHRPILEPLDTTAPPLSIFRGGICVLRAGLSTYAWFVSFVDERAALGPFAVVGVAVLVSQLLVGRLHDKCFGGEGDVHRADLACTIACRTALSRLHELWQPSREALVVHLATIEGYLLGNADGGGAEGLGDGVAALALVAADP